MSLSNHHRLLAGSILITLAAIRCGSDPPPDGRATPAEPSRARVIVLITVDGLVPAHLSAFGGPVATPGLARLAQEGFAWPDAWTTCPMTRPAAASYLTGLAPDRHGVRDDLYASLAESTPTLAGVLAERGYRTAAFPGSSFLGFGSGLLRGFDVVDDAPVAYLGPARWLPAMQEAEDQAASFARWVRSLPPGERYFAWLHSSLPLRAQMVREREEALEAFSGLDRILQTVLSAIDEHGDGDHSALVVAGTLGAVDGPTIDLPGLGFSVDESAVRVPIFARFPPGETPHPALGVPRWAPDVAVTLAELGGARLPDAEGVSLFQRPAADRVLFAWSWATRDQFGWTPQRAARLGAVRRVESFGARNERLDGEPLAEADAAVAQRLGAALAARDEAPQVEVPIEQVRSVLEERGVELQPVPAAGRPFGPAESRKKAAVAVWDGRRALLVAPTQFPATLEAALEADPDNLAALVDRAQTLRGSEKGAALARRAVELYPTHPEAVHAYAHSIWKDSWRDGRRLIEAALPTREQDPDLLYDLACASSLSGDVEGAERYLRRSIVAGFDNFEHIATDADLRNLRRTAGFLQLMQEYRR